jgi:hypothetical protein
MANKIHISSKSNSSHRNVYTGSWDISGLEAFFAGVDVPQSIRLNACSFIEDVPSFIINHIDFVKENDGNSTFYPYLERLQTLRNLLQIK